MCQMQLNQHRFLYEQMGITPMGDIIGILRHAKAVSDQAARDNILAENETIKSVVKEPPVSSTAVCKETNNLLSWIFRNSLLILARSVVVATSRRSEPISKSAVRRVLPIHEGKYKVSLPKGTTKKTREILAKHSALQSDKSEKKSVFDRLNTKHVEIADSTSSEPPVKLPKPVSSIFNRLGNYKEAEKSSNVSSGILRSSLLMVGKVTTFHCLSYVKMFEILAGSWNRQTESSEADCYKASRSSHN